MIQDVGEEVFTAFLFGAATGTMEQAISSTVEFLAVQKIQRTIEGEIIRVNGLEEPFIQIALSLEHDSAAYNLARRITDRLESHLVQLGMDTDYVSNLSPDAYLEAIDQAVRDAGATAEELGQLQALLKDERYINLARVDSTGQFVESSNGPSRPTWRESEEYALNMYSAFRPQVSFDQSRNEVPYGTKGSIRPDGYAKNSSLEVKNYSLETNSRINHLVNDVVKQYNQRIAMLPEGTQQIVWIDIRGQHVTSDVLSQLQQQIQSQTQMIVVFGVQ